MNMNLKDEFLATFYIETDQDLSAMAEKIASLETTGSWHKADEKPSDLFLQCMGKVGEVRETSPGVGEIDILFPLINLNLLEGAFADLWLTMVGGGTHALKAYKKSRLIDFRLPEKALTFFPGPAFGQKGLRELLEVDEEALIIGTIIKPTAGLTPEEVAEICYQMAVGGVRYIKDDEKMLNPSYCPLEARVKAVSVALKRAEDKTGLKVLYSPHITADPPHLMRNAEIALHSGATALMLNIFAAGFGGLEMLRKNFEPNVPIYAHCGGKEAFSRAPGQGVDPKAIVRFVRLLGGDMFRVSTVGGYLVGSDPDEVSQLIKVMNEPMGKIKHMMPVVSGGLNPRTLAPNLQIVGKNAMMFAGTGITQHPMGAQAGAMALYQAAEAFKKGVSLDDYAKNHEELRLSLQ
jgi:ribulose 1,5-bisphosphate carboxylase large subunit-like protein